MGTFNSVGFDHWRLADAKHLVIVEIALHDAVYRHAALHVNGHLGNLGHVGIARPACDFTIALVDIPLYQPAGGEATAAANEVSWNGVIAAEPTDIRRIVQLAYAVRPLRGHSGRGHRHPDVDALDLLAFPGEGRPRRPAMPTF